MGCEGTEVVRIPSNGAIGDCAIPLPSGASCTPTCNSGFTAFGGRTCLTWDSGKLADDFECQPNCDGSVAPVNGGVGDCTDDMKSGSLCTPSCDAGYTTSGTFRATLVAYY